MDAVVEEPPAPPIAVLGQVYPPIRIYLQTRREVTTAAWMRVDGPFGDAAADAVLAGVARLYLDGIRRFVLDLRGVHAPVPGAAATCVAAIAGLRDRHGHLVLVSAPSGLREALANLEVRMRVTLVSDLVSAFAIVASARVA